MKKNSSKERLFEVMGRLDKTFKPKLSESTIKTKNGEEIDVQIGSGQFLSDIHVNDISLDEMLDTPAGLEDAIGNFKSGKISLARYLEWMVEQRDEGVTEETLQNNRLFRINIEELVKHYNKYKSQMGDDYSDYDVGEQKNMGRMMEDYDPKENKRWNLVSIWTTPQTEEDMRNAGFEFDEKGNCDLFYNGEKVGFFSNFNGVKLDDEYVDELVPMFQNFRGTGVWNYNNWRKEAEERKKHYTGSGFSFNEGEEEISVEPQEHGPEGPNYKAKLEHIVDHAQKIYEGLSEGELPSWVQDKITIADDYLDAIYSWMHSEEEEKEGEIEGPNREMDDEELDVNVNEGTLMATYEMLDNQGNLLATTNPIPMDDAMGMTDDELKVRDEVLQQLKEKGRSYNDIAHVERV
jgi:hypothetical protein